MLCLSQNLYILLQVIFATILNLDNKEIGLELQHKMFLQDAFSIDGKTPHENYWWNISARWVEIFFHIFIILVHRLFGPVDVSIWKENIVKFPSCTSLTAIYDSSSRWWRKSWNDALENLILALVFSPIQGFIQTILMSIRRQKKPNLLIEFSNSIFKKFYFKVFWRWNLFKIRWLFFFKKCDSLHTRLNCH